VTGRADLDQFVGGPTLTLAARIKKALDSEFLQEHTDYGTFFVSRVELQWSDGGDSEVVGYLVPDEGKGETLDFYTAKR
jgi:hypothetical protein